MTVSNSLCFYVSVGYIFPVVCTASCSIRPSQIKVSHSHKQVLAKIETQLLTEILAEIDVGHQRFDTISTNL